MIRLNVCYFTKDFYFAYKCKCRAMKEKSYFKFLGSVRNRFSVREFRSWSLGEISISIRIRVRIQVQIRQGLEQILGAKFDKLSFLLTKWKIYGPIRMMQFKSLNSIPILTFNDPIHLIWSNQTGPLLIKIYEYLIN